MKYSIVLLCTFSFLYAMEEVSQVDTFDVENPVLATLDQKKDPKTYTVPMNDDDNMSLIRRKNPDNNNNAPTGVIHPDLYNHLRGLGSPINLASQRGRSGSPRSLVSQMIERRGFSIKIYKSDVLFELTEVIAQDLEDFKDMSSSIITVYPEAFQEVLAQIGLPSNEIFNVLLMMERKNPETYRLETQKLLEVIVRLCRKAHDENQDIEYLKEHSSDEVQVQLFQLLNKKLNMEIEEMQNSSRLQKIALFLTSLVGVGSLIATIVLAM